MKKDIEISVVKDVYVAIAHEWNKEFLSKNWNAYIINNRSSPIEMALVVSKGYDDERKTSEMRYAFGVIAAKAYEKIEMVLEEVLALNNEFYVTYYADNKVYEKRFLFTKNSVSEKKLVLIPLLEKEGVFAK